MNGVWSWEDIKVLCRMTSKDINWCLCLIVVFRLIITGLLVIILLLWLLIVILCRWCIESTLEGYRWSLCLRFFIDWSGSCLINVVLWWCKWWLGLCINAEGRGSFAWGWSWVVFWIEINVWIFTILTVIDFACFECGISIIIFSMNCWWWDINIGTLNFNQN